MENDLYVITWENTIEDINNKDKRLRTGGLSEIIDGEDAMNERVCEICKDFNISEDEIHVFLMSSEI